MPQWWGSKLESSKQEKIAESTTKAKYIVASKAAKEAIWIKKFVSKLVVVLLCPV